MRTRSIVIPRPRDPLQDEIDKRMEKKAMERWNYRIIHRKLGEEHIFFIAEVYYRDSKPHSYGEPGTPWGDSTESLRQNYADIMKAFSLPPINEEHFTVQGDQFTEGKTDE